VRPRQQIKACSASCTTAGLQDVSLNIAEHCGKRIDEVWNDALTLRQPTNYNAISQHRLRLATQQLR
jgi:hypothetical protein